MQLSLISLALTKVYGRAAAFSPSSLFASGEQGAWYDPSDLTTMFQDSLCTTPVTADGQPVGLILDKSKSLALGTELAVNGDFNSGTGWTLVGSSISGGNLTFSSSALNDYASNSGGISAENVLFEITFTITSIASGSVRTQAGGIAGTDRTLAGTYSERLVSVSGASLALVATSANTTAVISDISLKVVTGNHASQATAASRPLYKTDGTYHWLQFDGVDDSLSTAAINFTSTSQMSVFSGSLYTNNSMSVAVELNNMNSGESFGLFTPETATTIQFGIHGSGGYELEVITGSFANSKFVLSSLANRVAVSGNLIAMRMDGVPAGTTTRADPITEAFGNYPLYVGGRENTSLYLNGNIYSLIVRGALSTADEITATETWVNSKTGAY